MSPWLALKLIIFTVLVPGTVAVFIPYRLLGPGAALRRSPWTFAGLACIVLGALLLLRCIWSFGAVGQGTPAPIDPPKVFVARGPYRVVRNPMYIGVLLVLFGESIVFASTVLLRYALIVWAFFHLFVVFYEERTLRNKFGAAYEDYRREVPRWVPRLRRGIGC